MDYAKSAGTKTEHVPASEETSSRRAGAEEQLIAVAAVSLTSTGRAQLDAAAGEPYSKIAADRFKISYPDVNVL